MFILMGKENRRTQTEILVMREKQQLQQSQFQITSRDPRVLADPSTCSGEKPAPLLLLGHWKFLLLWPVVPRSMELKVLSTG